MLYKERHIHQRIAGEGRCFKMVLTVPSQKSLTIVIIMIETTKTTFMIVVEVITTVMQNNTNAVLDATH